MTWSAKMSHDLSNLSVLTPYAHFHIALGSSAMLGISNPNVKKKVFGQ